MSFLQRMFGRSAETPSDRQSWLLEQSERVGRAVAERYSAELARASRSFESAETKPWTASWSTTASDINDLLSRQLPIMRSRASNAARDNEWAVRYLIQIDDNILGEMGIQLQMRVKGADGEFDLDANSMLERHWENWGKAADVSGAPWRDVESLALSSEERCGELLYRMRPGRGPYGFQVQLLDPRLLDVQLRRDWGGNRVRMGVEIDDDGAPVAYWLKASKVGDSMQNSDITTVGKHLRVPADQIRHRFVRSEIGQLRGIPALAIGARRLWQLNDFEESAAVASSNAAKRQGFFVSPDGNAPPGFADSIVEQVLDAARAEGKTLSPEELVQLKSVAQRFATTMPGQYDTLPQGYDFRQYDSKWPDISAEGYIKQQVRAWSAPRGVSYHTLGNDLESVNYSSAQVGIGDERLHYRRRQKRLISWLHADVALEVLRRAPLYEKGLLPSRMGDFIAAIDWLPRTWAPIDPLKTEESNDIALRNKSTTRRRIWLSKGLDPDDMAREVQEDIAQFGSLDATKNAGTAAASAKHDKEERDEQAGRRSNVVPLAGV